MSSQSPQSPKTLQDLKDAANNLKAAQAAIAKVELSLKKAETLGDASAQRTKKS